MGHIRDLPKSKLGVDVDNDFEPIYVDISSSRSMIIRIATDCTRPAESPRRTFRQRNGLIL